MEYVKRLEWSLCVILNLNSGQEHQTYFWNVPGTDIKSKYQRQNMVWRYYTHRSLWKMNLQNSL